MIQGFFVFFEQEKPTGESVEMNNYRSISVDC